MGQGPYMYSPVDETNSFLYVSNTQRTEHFVVKRKKHAGPLTTFEGVSQN